MKLNHLKDMGTLVNENKLPNIKILNNNADFMEKPNNDRKDKGVDEFMSAMMMLQIGSAYLSSKLSDMAETCYNQIENDKSTSKKQKKELRYLADNKLIELNGKNLTMIRNIRNMTKTLDMLLTQKIPKGKKGLAEIRKMQDTAIKCSDMLINITMKELDIDFQEKTIDIFTDFTSLFLSNDSSNLHACLLVEDQAGSILHKNNEGNLIKCRIEH